MKQHTIDFKNEIKELGREIDSKIYYNNEIISAENLYSVRPILNAELLKSVMKGLEFESSIKIDKGTIVRYEFGLKINQSYEYINYGNYIISEKPEYNEDTKTYSYICCDKMLYSMKEYSNLEHGTFPMSVREYLTNLCLDCNLIFKNKDDTFVNYDKIIQNDLYANLGYTYRDIFDELSQVAAGCICIASDDTVEVRYINNTNDTIDEEYFEEKNVKFGSKYGPINSIVLSRSAESDNVYLRDEDSVANNGLCEIKIIDNQIMNFNDRSDYLQEILNKLNGLEFYVNDFASKGILYYELCDKYNVKIGNNNYTCIMLNDEQRITQGIAEKIYTDMPKETVTDYTKSDKTDRRVNQLYIIANKQERRIEALASEVTEDSEKVAKLEIDVNSIKESVQKTLNITKTVQNKNKLTLTDCANDYLNYLKIRGDISLLFGISEASYGYDLFLDDNLTLNDSLTLSEGIPYELRNGPLYSSDMLFGRNSNLVIKNGNDVQKIKLPINYLNYIDEETYDEFIVDKKEMFVIRRVGINENYEKYKLPFETKQYLGTLEVILKEGTNEIYLESFNNATLECTYMIKNDYTNTFATKVELQAGITTTAESVLIEAQKKMDDLDVVSKLNISPEVIEIIGNRLVIDTSNFKLDEKGNAKFNDATATNLQIDGGAISLVSPYQKAKLNLIASEDEQLNSAFCPAAWYMNGNGYQFNVGISGDYLGLALRHSEAFGIGAHVTTNDVYMSFSDRNNNITEITPSKITTPVLSQTSLESKKKNFEYFDKGLELINSSDFYLYNFKTESDDDKKHIGLVIGEGYKTPLEFINSDETGIELYSLISACGDAIKTLSNEVKNLKKEIEVLKNGK